MRALESSLELRQAARHGAAARLDLHVVGGGPLEQPLLGVHLGLAVDPGISNFCEVFSNASTASARLKLER